MVTADDRNAIRDGVRNLYNRAIEADRKFIADVVEQFSTTEAEADKVLRVFQAMKVVKVDLPMMRYNLTHGAYWEAPVIARAIALPEAELPKKFRR